MRRLARTRLDDRSACARLAPLAATPTRLRRGLGSLSRGSLARRASAVPVAAGDEGFATRPALALVGIGVASAVAGGPALPAVVTLLRHKGVTLATVGDVGADVSGGDASRPSSSPKRRVHGTTAAVAPASARALSGESGGGGRSERRAADPRPAWRTRSETSVAVSSSGSESENALWRGRQPVLGPFAAAAAGDQAPAAAVGELALAAVGGAPAWATRTSSGREPKNFCRSPSSH